MKIMKSLALTGVLVLGILFSAKSQSVEDAIKHVDAERFTAAAKVIDQVIATNPTPEAYFAKGYSLLRSTAENLQPEVIKQAQEAFEKGNALDKKGDPLNTVGLGMVKLASKDFAGAKLIFEEVTKRTKSKDTEVLYRIGEAYTLFPAANDPAEAIINLNMALEKSKVKDNPEYYIALSDAYLMKGEGGDAMNALANAERLGKKKARIYEKMSKIWLQSKNYKEAKEAIDKGVAADGEHAPIYKYLSSFSQTFQKYDESAQAAKKYLEKSDGDCKAKLRYVKLAFIAKDYANVEKTINEIKDCSQDPIVLRLQGIAKFEQKMPAEAIELLKKFVATAPKEEVYGLDYGFIGRSYLDLPGEGEVKEKNDSLAITYIEKAVQMNDTTFSYYKDLGTRFKTAKNYDKAALYLEKAITTSKKPTGAEYADLGILYYQIKNYEKADAAIDKVLEAYKDSWPGAYALSAKIKIFKNQKDSTFSANFGAYPIYEKYLSLLPTDEAKAKSSRDVVDALLYLAAREYLVTKDNAKATNYINEVLKLDPANPRAKELSDKINGITTPVTTAPADTTKPKDGKI